MKYKLTLAYDGTRYNGWQRQPNGVTIQQKVEEALFILLKTRVAVIGSGRTDAGVHALGQVAHFTSPTPLDSKRLLASLNGLLPSDIRVREVEAAPTTFHAQISAVRKTYHYHLYFPRVQDPFRQAYHWQVYDPLNLTHLREAAAHFVGTRDFTSFANEAHTGSAGKNPVRTLYRLDIVPEENGLRLEFEGNGFLYKMVRNIVGHLVEVARGKSAPADIPKILAARDRRKASKAAPAHGLFLAYVAYSEERTSTPSLEKLSTSG